MASAADDDDEQDTGTVGRRKSSIFKCEYLKENVPSTVPGDGWSLQPPDPARSDDAVDDKPLCEALERGRVILKTIGNNNRPPHEAVVKTEAPSESTRGRKLICEALETSKVILEALERMKKDRVRVSPERGPSALPEEGAAAPRVSAMMEVCPHLLRETEGASVAAACRRTDYKSSLTTASRNATLRDVNTTKTITSPSEARLSRNIAVSPPGEGGQRRPVSSLRTAGTAVALATPVPLWLRTKRPEGSTTPGSESRDETVRNIMIRNISQAGHRRRDDEVPPFAREHEWSRRQGRRSIQPTNSPEAALQELEGTISSSKVSTLEKEKISSPPESSESEPHSAADVNMTLPSNLICEFLTRRRNVPGPQREVKEHPSGDLSYLDADDARRTSVPAQGKARACLARHERGSSSPLSMRPEYGSPEDINSSGSTPLAWEQLRPSRRTSNTAPRPGWGPGWGCNTSLPQPGPTNNANTALTDRPEDKYRVNIDTNSNSLVRASNKNFTTGSNWNKAPEFCGGRVVLHNSQYLSKTDAAQSLPQWKSFRNRRAPEASGDTRNGVFLSPYDERSLRKITNELGHQAAFPDQRNFLTLTGSDLVKNGNMSQWVFSPSGSRSSGQGGSMVSSGHAREHGDKIAGKTESSKNLTNGDVNTTLSLTGTAARPTPLYPRWFTDNSLPCSKQRDKDPIQIRGKNINNFGKDKTRYIDSLQSHQRGGAKDNSNPSSRSDKDETTAGPPGEHKFMTTQVLSAPRATADTLNKEGDHRQPETSHLSKLSDGRKKKQLISTMEASKNSKQNSQKPASFTTAPAGVVKEEEIVKREDSLVRRAVRGEERKEDNDKLPGITWVSGSDSMRRLSATSSPRSEDGRNNHVDRGLSHTQPQHPNQTFRHSEKENETKQCDQIPAHTTGVTSNQVPAQTTGVTSDHLEKRNTVSRTSSASRRSSAGHQSDCDEFSDSSGSEALEKYDLVWSVTPDSNSPRENDLGLVSPSLTPGCNPHHY